MAKRVSSVPGVKFRWNPHLGSTGRYIDDKGRIISQESVTRETEKVITGVGLYFAEKQK